MQLSGYGIPRTPLLSTSVNKGKKKDRGYYTPAIPFSDTRVM